MSTIKNGAKILQQASEETGSEMSGDETNSCQITLHHASLISH
jgi:hypothetical protein